MISVLIPTRDRPDFLKHAIESVRRQSGIELIKEVIVSNNGTVDVAEIVNSFNVLPVSYVKQTKPLRPGDHIEWLVNQAKCPLVAMLADDDMWGRYHLEEAVRLFSKHPSAVAVFNQTVAVRNVSRQLIGGFARLRNSYSTKQTDHLSDAFVFEPGQLLVDLLIMTPLNIWSMVAKKSNIVKHIGILSGTDPGIDSDRYFIWRLNKEGVIVVGLEIGLFMRCHSDMRGAVLERQAKHKYSEITKEYSRQIINEAESMGLPVKEQWDLFWTQLSSEDHEAVCRQGYGECIAFASELLRSDAASLKVDRPAESKQRRNALSRFVQECLPPIIFRQLARLQHIKGQHDVKRSDI